MSRNQMRELGRSIANGLPVNGFEVIAEARIYGEAVISLELQSQEETDLT